MSQIFPTDPFWFHHLQIEVAVGVGASAMLLAIQALTLDQSQFITLLFANFNLLAVNKVISLRNFALLFLATRFHTLFTINFNVNEFTRQYFVEIAWSHLSL